MSPLHASFLALASAYAGMVALAFAMDRHHAQLTGAQEVPLARQRLLRCAGALLLAAAGIPCVLAWGATVGPVAWLGWLSAGALGAAGFIGAAARVAAGVACAAAAAAVLGLVHGV
jgi:hypothetical protein